MHGTDARDFPEPTIAKPFQHSGSPAGQKPGVQEQEGPQEAHPLPSLTATQLQWVPRDSDRD